MNAQFGHNELFQKIPTADGYVLEQCIQPRINTIYNANTVSNIYIDSVNGQDADTPDIGSTPEKAFATLRGAAEYSLNCIAENAINFNLLSDIVETDDFIQPFNSPTWIINGNSHKITTKRAFFYSKCHILDANIVETNTVVESSFASCNGGYLHVSGCNVSGNTTLLGALDGSTLFVNNTTITGTGTNAILLYARAGAKIIIGAGTKVAGNGACVIAATRCCHIAQQNADTALTGSFTGKKWSLTQASILSTSERYSSYPGTVAGTLGAGCSAI